MPIPDHIARATYKDQKVADYKGNPLIEALPLIMTNEQIKEGLSGKIDFNPEDIYADEVIRAHIIPSLLYDFFQPLAAHRQLEMKLSLMIRRGYIGRNLKDGLLNTHLQNGYERIMNGDLNSFRFNHATSTASSLLLMGCSGSGKTTTLERILNTYQQVIFHEEHNFIQVVYLKIDCPHDGGLKSLCINFFIALDKALNTNYEEKYVRKRHSIETLLSFMSQVANLHAVGVLVIDEIQHLSRSKSGGIDKMLNFFVTLVNTIGLPVVFIGTPKARPIFESDLRSARRGSGFGALLWEPMDNPPPVVDQKTGKIKRTEWRAFTNVLWKYQWLKNRDKYLSEKVRECWYDLSQGVHDIVVKLFALAQIRAIEAGTECITTELLETVYRDEFKPVHPMLEALRSKDPEEIARYSDLTLPGMDKRMLELSSAIDESLNKKEFTDVLYGGNKQAEKLHDHLMGLGCPESRTIPLVKRVFKEHPHASMLDLMEIVLKWYKISNTETEKHKSKKTKSVPKNDWNKLDSGDLRFAFSQVGGDGMYQELKNNSLIFDMGSWLQKVI